MPKRWKVVTLGSAAASLALAGLAAAIPADASTQVTFSVESVHLCAHTNNKVEMQAFIPDNGLQLQDDFSVGGNTCDTFYLRKPSNAVVTQKFYGYQNGARIALGGCTESKPREAIEASENSRNHTLVFKASGGDTCTATRGHQG